MWVTRLMSPNSASEYDDRHGTIRVERTGRVEIVTFNRPDVLNCFSRQMYRAVADTLERAAEDPDAAVAVLTGAGRAFSSGVDLKERAEHERNDPRPARADFERFIDTIAGFPKPLICAVNGIAVGIGATLLGLADLVLMSESAKVQLPFARLSITPEAGSTYTFPAVIGPYETAWLMFSGEWMPAAECRTAGLAWRLCAPDRLMPDTMGYARVIAQQPVDQLVTIKSLLVSSRRDAIHAARVQESKH